MPGIQFSAGTYSTPSNAIRLQNFLLTYNAGGPTSETGYWTQYPSPNNGWVIYIDKATQGPSIYACNNDTDLVNAASQLSNTTITSVDAAINYFNNQTDKIIVGTPLPNILLDGLQMYLDAGIVQSYNRTGTTWNNLIYGNPNGTLVNGPTFNSGNGGSIVFDGVDDYVITTGSSILQPASAITLEAVFQRDGGRTIINYGANSGGAGKIYCFEQASNLSAFQAKVTTTTSGQVTLNGPVLSTGTWYYAVMTYNGSTAILYINGLFYTSALASGNINYPANSNLNLGRKNAADGEYISGKIAFNRIYNRALSAEEVSQNYNAQKARFGL